MTDDEDGDGNYTTTSQTTIEKRGELNHTTIIKYKVIRSISFAVLLLPLLPVGEHPKYFQLYCYCWVGYCMHCHHLRCHIIL